VGTISLGRNNTYEAVKLGHKLSTYISDIEKKDLRGNQNNAIEYMKNAGTLIDKQVHRNYYHEGFIIIGPPGTGKTFVICLGSLLYLNRKDQLKIKKNRRWDQVAIATYTNAAADRVILEFNNLFDEANVPKSTRHSLVRRILSQEENINQSIKDYSNTLYKPSTMSRANWLDLKNHCDAARIFVGTIYAIRKAIKGGQTENILKNFQPSLILFDEASQINISQFNMTVYAAKKYFNAVGLIGDNSQLPPIKRIVDLKQDALSYLSGSNGGIIKINRKTQLDIQSRMHKTIRGLSQKIGEYTLPISDYYTTQLNDLGRFNPPKSSSKEIQELLNIGNRIIVLDNSTHPESEEIPIGTSKINKMEAKAAKIVAKLFKECYPDMDKNKIMIIVPYKKQEEEIKDPNNYRTGTVDKFQGQEANLVIATTVRTNPDISLDFVSDLRRINVMVSRAKTKLIILNNKETFQGNTIFEKIYDYIFKNPNEAKFINYNPTLENKIKNLIEL